MNELQIFSNEELGKIRAVLINEEPYFVGKDVALILGYVDTSDALKTHVDKEDKLTRCFTDSGQGRQMIIISESGLYSLIFGSHLPKAKTFKHWVTAEVLPSIRKHGIYATDEIMNKIIQDPDFGIRLFTELKTEREKNKQLEAENAQKDQLIGELKPKADYTDLILQNDSVVAVTQISKDYGMSAISFNELLHDLHIQYKTCGQWVLYAEHQNKGYAHSATTLYANGNGSCMVTMWTQKGRLFLYDLLKENGILPLIEQKDMQLTL